MKKKLKFIIKNAKETKYIKTNHKTIENIINKTQFCRQFLITLVVVKSIILNKQNIYKNFIFKI